MNVGNTKRFSCGSIDFDLTVYNAAPEGKQLTTNSIVMDELAAAINQVIDERIIPACRQLASTTSEDEVGSSQVNHGVSYDNEAFDVRIELCLQVNKAGVKNQLLSLLAHELTELHILPALAVELQQPAVNKGFMGSVLSFVLDADNLLNGRQPRRQNQSSEKDLLNDILAGRNPFDPRRFAARGARNSDRYENYTDFMSHNPFA